MNVDGELKRLLRDLPQDAAPRSQWPYSDPRKQTAIENRCFEDDATIYFDRLAPLQIWAPLCGMDMRGRTSFIVTNAARLALQANVKLTQAEIDSIAQSSAKNFKRGSWASPVAAVLAGAAAYQGRAQFRFPFYSPMASSWFDAQHFPSKRMAFLSGIKATYAWHAFRFMAYYPLIKIATAFFYGSIIRMSIAADVLSDPRLSRVNDAVMKQIGATRPSGSRRAPQTQPGGSRPVGEPVSQYDIERRDESYRRVGLPPPSPRQVQGTASQSQDSEPTSDGQFSGEWSSNESQQSGQPFESEGASASRSGFFGRAASGSSGRSDWTGASTEAQQKRAEQSGSWGDSELFGEDDASPVSAATRATQRQQAAYQTSSGASSWDRLRQQAKSDAGRGGLTQETAWTRRQQESASTNGNQHTTTNDSYSYNEADEAKAYAKSQAQKEFDAMLEAERKSDANSGSGKWR